MPQTTREPKQKKTISKGVQWKIQQDQVCHKSQMGHNINISNSQREFIWRAQQSSSSLQRSTTHNFQNPQSQEEEAKICRSSCLPHLLSVVFVGKHIHTKRTKVRGYLDLVFFITHYFVFITHNSKFVNFMTIQFVWICFQFLFPSLNSLIFD